MNTSARGTLANMKRHEVEWADGVVTPCVELRQSGTYAGLLEGIPTEDTNQRFHIQPLLSHKEGGLARILLWAPQTRPEGWPETYMRKPTAALPGVTCVATFQHFKPVRDQKMDASGVIAVWFQDEWAFPIADEVLAKIKSLAWRDVAVDYER